jgi:sec-independent protein translocase protein TatB
VFGFSLGEFMMICVVALVFVGPKKLPYVLNTLGKWIRKIRIMVQDMRSQSGIDDILRAEGLNGGLNELRSLVRVQHSSIISSVSSSISAAQSTPNSTSAATEPEVPAATTAPLTPSPYPDPAFVPVSIDPTKEYPPEGADAYGALPDDLIAPPFDPAFPALPATPGAGADAAADTVAAPTDGVAGSTAPAAAEVESDPEAPKPHTESAA